jgi:hypothetical protein
MNCCLAYINARIVSGLSRDFRKKLKKIPEEVKGAEDEGC